MICSNRWWWLGAWFLASADDLACTVVLCGHGNVVCLTPYRKLAIGTQHGIFTFPRRLC